MLEPLLHVVFSQDHRFLTLRTEGIPDSVQSALAAFWSDSAYEGLSSRAELAAREWKGLTDSLNGLARGGARDDPPAAWRQAAVASSELTMADPVAGVLVSLQALAAWAGALGDRLYFQPWEGHHPGWHFFPLVCARNLVAADAIWSALFLCEKAAGFIASAKDAPLHPALRGVIAEYEAVHGAAEKVRDEAVDELAWALHASLGAPGGFRPELAALFWTAGDLLHADLLGPEGPADSVPPFPMVRDLVDHGMRTLHKDPLAQYIWLDMKDRGPVSLRDHPVLFGRINNVFDGTVLHRVDAIYPLSVSRAYARVLIGAMRGRVEEQDRGELLDAMAMASSEVEAGAPDAYLRIAALVTGLGEAGAERDARWDSLAGMSAEILRWADEVGRYEPFDRVLDAPFHHLRADSRESLEQALDRVEAYRQANLGYWLAISPPLRGQPDVPEDLLEEERELLRELRGARFIRLLPHLPMHYRRFGFNMDDALAGPPPGVTPDEERGLLGFDPFDQATGARILKETRKLLTTLYERMRPSSPSYAATRLEPPSSAAAFVAALGAHRAGEPRAPRARKRPSPARAGGSRRRSRP